MTEKQAMIDHPYIRMVLTDKDGEKKAAQQHRRIFESAHGEEVASAKADVERYEREHDDALREEKRLKDKLRNTHPKTKMSQATGGTEKSDTPFKNWNLRDQIVVATALGMALICLFAGSINVYVNLLASGSPVFIDQPWTAILLSMLVPAGATSIKFGYNFIESDGMRLLYARLVYVVSGILLILWISLFAHSFHGVSAEIDWDSLGSTTTLQSFLDAAMVWTQSVAEMFIGASLFLVAEMTHQRYSSNYYMANPVFGETKRAYEAQQKILQQTEESLSQAQGRLDRITARQEVFVNEAVAEFLSQKN